MKLKPVELEAHILFCGRSCYGIVAGQLLMFRVVQIKLYCVGCWVSVLILGISIYWVDWGTAQGCVTVGQIGRIWNL